MNNEKDEFKFNGNRRFAQGVFENHFKKKMTGSYLEFRLSHPTLNNCILDAMEDAVRQCESAWQKMYDNKNEAGQ